MDNSKEKALAYEIALALDDLDSLHLHLSFVQMYKEEFLRKMLQKAMATPQEKIRRSRAALYVFLVNQHGKNAYRSRD